MPKIMKEEYQSVKKIKEASFFLNQLRENYNNLKTFDHFLNAFLSSARSITWIMKKDFSNNENWKKWYAQIEYNSEVEKIFNKITKLRNESQKERTVNSSLVATVNIPMKDVPPDKLDKLMGKIINADFKKPNNNGKTEVIVDIDGLKVKGEFTESKRVVDNLPDDIYELCTIYLHIIHQILKLSIYEYERNC